MDDAVVTTWIAEDPDDETAQELRELHLAAHGPDGENARAELADRFAGPLEFGTAGLRGRLGGGPNRMNRAVVIRATAAVAAFAREQLGGAARVVIGYDARHGSAQFARDAASVFTGAGAEVMVLARPLPTPVLAFAVQREDADIGVMITASHNPGHDNGYKVYLGGRLATGAGRGALVAAPTDAQIAAHVREVGSLRSIPRPAEGWGQLGEDVVAAYVERAVSLVPARAIRPVRVVYTPMHGVAGEIALAALRRIGVSDIHVVTEQAAPDPDFPTLPRPNPEEPGALEAALRLAEVRGAQLVIAHDPDGDRCAVAVPDPHTARGWRQLSGDELGALLGQQAAFPAALAGGGVLASSVVSARLLPKIATAHGLRHVTTLTGFKWISRVPGLIYGYEEALGYCVDPTAVRDKDGITAALRVVYLWSQLADRGATLLDELDDLAVTHGLHATDQVVWQVADPAARSAIMSRLRADAPQALGGSPVVAVEDLARGSRDLPPTEAIIWLTADDDRVILRPSGTEPKLKCYLEVVMSVPDRRDAPQVRLAAHERLTRLRSDVADLLAQDSAGVGEFTSLRDEVAEQA